MRICCRCDRVIRGAAEEIPVDSASAARPNQYRHVLRDPRCRPRRGGEQ